MDRALELSRERLASRGCARPALPLVLWLSVPRTGSRHLSDILTGEYGAANKLPYQLMLPQCGRWSGIHQRPMWSHGVERAAPESATTASACVAAEMAAASVWQAQLGAAIAARVRLITMVRRPLPWALSYFSLASNRSAGLAARQRGFADFVGSPFAPNYQLAFIVGKRLPHGFLLSAHRKAPSTSAGPGQGRAPGASTLAPCFQRPREATRAQATEADLRLVRGWIASGALLAGTTESFEAAVRNYASKLGWLRFNVSAERSFGPRLDTSEHGARALYRSGDVTVNPLTEAALLEAYPQWTARLSAELDESLDAQLHALARASTQSHPSL